MSYDPHHAKLLIRETDNAPHDLVTHQERALRNELSLALGEITALSKLVPALRAAREALVWCGSYLQEGNVLDDIAAIDAALAALTLGTLKEEKGS